MIIVSNYIDNMSSLQNRCAAMDAAMFDGAHFSAGMCNAIIR